MKHSFFESYCHILKAFGKYQTKSKSKKVTCIFKQRVSIFKKLLNICQEKLNFQNIFSNMLDYFEAVIASIFKQFAFNIPQIILYLFLTTLQKTKAGFLKLSNQYDECQSLKKKTHCSINTYCIQLLFRIRIIESMTVICQDVKSLHHILSLPVYFL